MSELPREDKESKESHEPEDHSESSEGHDTKVGQGTKEAQDPKAARDPKETLERRSSKSRLSKQDEIEEVEEEHDHSPSSEASDATIVPTGVDTPVVRTPGASPESNSPEDDNKLESQKSVDSDKNSPTQGNNPKAKLLVRSRAVCDDTSPPPEDANHAASSQTNTSNSSNLSATNSASVSPVPTSMATLTVSPTPHRHQKLEKDSSQGSMSDNSNSPMLSRDSSMDKYTDSTGTDLESFIIMTLNKNRNDRNTLLELEDKLTKFIKESKQQYFKFAQMSSYHRMLVHRVAAFFGLDHNVDQSGKCVVVNRTSNTRIPDFKFKDHISEDMPDDKPKVVLRRAEKCGSLDESRNSEKIHPAFKSKSLEERKDHYEKIKKQIFEPSSGNDQDGGAHESSTSQPSIQKSSLSSSKDEAQWSRWSSADSSGYSTDNSMKTQKITKASSFPLYVLSNESKMGSMSNNTHLSKTDSLSSGTSGLGSPMARPVTIQSSPPSEQLSESSGSNQSATSPAQLHTQTGDGQSPGPLVPSFYDEKGQPMTIWVATSPHMIPLGSIIINKQTCQPYLNPDGSPYRWNPNHQGQIPNIIQGQNSQYPGPNQAQQLLPGQQGDIYSTVPYNGQQRGQQQQQQLAPPIQHLPQDSTSNSASMTLSPQHSTESLPPESSGGMPTQQPAMISNVPQGNVAQPQPPAPPQPQPPQGYNHMLQQQVPYFMPNTSTCNPQLRIMYQTPMPFQRPSSQGQVEVQGQGQVLTQPGQGQGQLPAAVAANGQYGVPQSAYQSPFSQLTVHSVETYQQQQLYQQNMMGQAGYTGDMAAQQQQAQQQQAQQQQAQQQQAPQQQVQQQQQGISLQQTELASSQLNYNQYMSQGGTDGAAMPQGAYIPVPGCMPPSTAPGASNTTHIVAFQGNQAPAPAQAHFAGNQATTAYRPKSPPSQTPVANLTPQGASTMTGVSIGHVMPNMPINPPHYVSYTYPNQQQQGPTMPPGATHPQQVAPQSVNLGPRHQTPQVWNPLSQGIAGSQTPTQGYPLMRPHPVQIGDSRFVGQPLQQVHRPQITPLLTGRPRVPTPTGGPSQCAANPVNVAATRGGKGRKSWSKGSRDSALSPQSSVESTESSEELSGSSTLEVSGLPTQLTKENLDVYLSDLIKLGARIHVLGEDDGDSTANKALSELTVVAVFESEQSAVKAQSLSKHNQFKLRPMCLRSYESSDLAPISEHAS